MDLDYTKAGTRSLRKGGASLMFDMGFELESAKRWGRRISTARRNYLWHDEQIISHIGRGMLSGAPVSGKWAQPPSGRAGGERSKPTYRAIRTRLVEISKTMTAAMRRRRLEGMYVEGRVPVRTVCELKRQIDLRATIGDIRLIAACGGDKGKRRFEISKCDRRIRCAQGQSSGSGVRPDVLQIAQGAKYVIHGTTLAAAHCIEKEGIRKGDRLHVHFYECGADCRA